MIQRTQTLFLLLSIVASVALMLVSSNSIGINGTPIEISLSPLPPSGIEANLFYYIGTTLTIAGSVLALITIFIFKNRALQIKLCYVLLFMQLAITLIVSFCPLVVLTEGITYTNSIVATIIGLGGVISASLAARYIKKDVALLKSANRIR